MRHVYSFWCPPPSDVEDIFGESETIPDQSLSVRDILTRYTRGQLSLPPIETGDDDDIDAYDGPDDLIDAHEYAGDLPSLATRYSDAIKAKPKDESKPASSEPGPAQ